MKKGMFKTAFSAAILCCLISSANAATIAKTNNLDNLNLASSWIGNVAPGAADVAQWDATVSSASTVALGEDLEWAGIKIINPGGAVTIDAGNTLRLGAAGISMSSATVDLTILCEVQLLAGRSQLWNVATGRTLTLDTGVFEREQGALLLVQGTGSVKAHNVVNNPTGIVGPWAHLGSGANTRYITVNNGSVINYSGTAVANAAGITDTTGTVNYETGAGGTLGAEASIHTLRYTGGAATISGALKTDGIMHCGSGTLTLNSSITIGNGRELTLLLPANKQVTISGAISNNAAGASGLIKGGPGQLRLQCDYTFTGPIAVGDGILQLAPTVNGATIPGDVYLNSNAQIQYNSDNSQTFSGVIAGPGQISKWNGGTLTLTGSNTFEGVSSINAGIIKLGHSNALGMPNGVSQLRRFNDATRGSVRLNGFSTDETFSFEDSNNSGTYIGYGGFIENYNTLTTAVLRGAVTLNKHGTFRGSGDMILRGIVSGPGNFIKDGSSTVNIETNTTFTGNLSVLGGTVQLRRGGLLSDGDYAGDILLSSTLMFNTRTNQTLNGTISGTGQLQKWWGESTLILNGDNPFSGSARLYSGTVKLGHSNALGTNAGATQIRRFDDGNRGKLDLNGQTISEPLSFEDGGNSGSTLGYGGYLENNNPLAPAECSGAVALNKHGSVQGSGDITLSGIISGSGRFYKQGTNTLTISGANTYTNQTVLGSGTLRLGADNTLPAESDVILWNATLDASVFSNTGASLRVRGNGNLALDDGAQLSFGSSRDKDWSGTLGISGTLKSRSLHFTDGLTAAQLSSITYNGNRVYLTASGYVIGHPPATLMIVR